jgi:hypothetical protein
MAHTDRALDPRTRATQERRRSGGHGVHGDRRTRRLKTRTAQKARAIREYA